MSRLFRILSALLMLAALSGVAAAEGLVSVPQFSEHQIPTSVPPSARSEFFEHLDLAFLLAALSLASFFALVLRWRRGLFLLAVASLAWLGFWREGCVCPIGAIQNVSLAVFDRTYAIPLVAVVLFTLPLLFALFFGRAFCAAVCPLGAVQEVVAIRPVKVPTWLDHALGLLAYVYLGAAVLFAATGTAFVICRYDPFVGFFRLSGSVNMLVLGGCFLLVGMFVGRPYCRYLCPYGALLGLCSKTAKWHVRVTPTECIQCRLCEDACPYGAIQEPTVDQQPGQRRRGRLRLMGLILLLPALAVCGGWLGRKLEVPLSKMHPAVRLAERIRLEDRMRMEVQARLQQRSQPAPVERRGQLEKNIWLEVLEENNQTERTTDASDAFRNTGRPVEQLYGEALRLRGRFGFAGGLLGVWAGLVVGVKLIHLSIRRRRVDYEPDRAGCVSCGRCFWYCPHEQVRLGLIQDVAPYRPPAVPHKET